jgi:molybdopterin-guanine dinucleotide biosynthesis protein A
MLGTILCGGQSTRMGSDKGLMKMQADTWAKVAFDKIAALSLPVVVSVNSKQQQDYVAVFPDTPLIKDNDSLKLKGPLCGVLSVHLAYPSEDLIILACDMPLLESVLLKDLLKYYQDQQAPDAFVYTNDGQPEPLCGIYKAKGLAHIIQLYQSGQLPRHSMKYMLEHINTFLIPLPGDQKNSFRNFNAHAELNGL